MKKGFTLVELLAVIVILAIIALIATPIIIDFVNKTEEKTVINSSHFYIEAIDLAISLHELDDIEIKDGIYTIMDDGNICLEHEDDTCKKILKIDGKGDMPTGGNISVVNGKVSNSNLRYDENTVVINGELNPQVCSITDDKDKDGIADTGDMITCVAESFHVINNENGTISMFAQYNLDVGNIYDEENHKYYDIENPTGIQKEEAKGYTSNSLMFYGGSSFSKVSYWYDFDNEKFIIDANYISEGREYPYIYGVYDENTIYKYVKVYEEYLLEKGVISAKATLISYEQLKDLGCNKSEWAGTSSPYDWTYSTSYWTGSNYDGNYVWCMGSDGYFYYSHYTFDSDFGVRPVVNISVDELK